MSRGDCMGEGKIQISKKDNDEYKVISIRIKGKTLNSIESLASQTNRSRNEVINILLETSVENTVISDN